MNRSGEIKKQQQVFPALLQSLVPTCLCSLALNIDKLWFTQFDVHFTTEQATACFFNHKAVKMPSLMARWHSIPVPVVLFYPLMRGCRKTSITRSSIQIWAYEPLGRKSLIPPSLAHTHTRTETDHLSTPSHSRLQRRDLSPHHAATQVAHTHTHNLLEGNGVEHFKNSGQLKGRVGECLP